MLRGPTSGPVPVKGHANSEDVVMEDQVVSPYLVLKFDLSRTYIHTYMYRIHSFYCTTSATFLHTVIIAEDGCLHQGESVTVNDQSVACRIHVASESKNIVLQSSL